MLLKTELGERDIFSNTRFQNASASINLFYPKIPASLSIFHNHYLPITYEKSVWGVCATPYTTSNGDSNVTNKTAKSKCILPCEA
jgi:hypothetical protein